MEAPAVPLGSDKEAESINEHHIQYSKRSYQSHYHMKLLGCQCYLFDSTVRTIKALRIIQQTTMTSF